MRRFLVVMSVATLFPACLSVLPEPSGTDAGGPTQDAGGISDGGSPIRYPRGPYGTEDRATKGGGRGDTIENIVEEGYRDDSSGWGDVRLSDFYSGPGTGGTRLILVELAAGWDIWSKTEASTLTSVCNEKKQLGLVCYVALAQGEIIGSQSPKPATKEDVDAFRQAYSWQGPIVADAEQRWKAYVPPDSPREAYPVTYYIDAKTMEILEAHLGYNEVEIRIAIDRNLP